MPLGLRWQQRLGVPYVLDIQDPWVNDHYQRTGQSPPGGKIKHGITQWFAARTEPATIRGAAHTTVVSEHYISNLIARYPDLSPDKFTTLPFAATPRDYELVAEENVVQDKFDPNDGLNHWVYIGRCGPDMQFSLTAMLLAFRNALQSGQLLENVRMHFLGTDYATKDQAKHWVLPIARELGITEYVTEVPDRVPYFQVLRCLQQASALIVPGSDDPRYTASKLYPYISAARPCLTVFHQNSSVNRIMSETKAGVAVTFDSEDSVETVAGRIQRDWFSAQQYKQMPKTDWVAFSPYTAESMTHRLTRVFDDVVDASR
ncbi:glycosyltransferase family protein [Neorhodopirellula pilleata]|nr:glycosyltransferase family 4 protein [Neorhodopirellula pilleata]